VGTDGATVVEGAVVTGADVVVAPVLTGAVMLGGTELCGAEEVGVVPPHPPATGIASTTIQAHAAIRNGLPHMNVSSPERTPSRG